MGLTLLETLFCAVIGGAIFAGGLWPFARYYDRVRERGPLQGWDKETT